MNTQQILKIRDELAEIVHDWKGFGQHPIPDTIDAAVGVMREAGFVVIRCDWNPFQRRYEMAAASDSPENEVYIESSGILLTDPFSDDAVAKQYELAHWQLALACVKAGKGKGDA